ncbi:MAG: hypothetical protein J5888_01185 [Bacteroidaceae bacterium]|nr:hypothetical protein [Bacteroidaceae bacterium]
MKKTYIAPAMEVTEIAMVNMIAASDSKVLGSSLSPSSSEAPMRGFDDFDEEDIKLW